MRTILTGDQVLMLGAKLAELNRQVFLQREYGFDPEKLNAFLQRAIEGRWSEATPRWIEKNSVLYFTLTSSGKTGEEWVDYLESKGIFVDDYIRSVLRHKNFRPTKAGTLHNISIIRGDLFSDENRTMKSVCNYAKGFEVIGPCVEVACLIRESFTDKEIGEMGLRRIITMHEPIPDFNGNPCVLGASIYERNWINTYPVTFDRVWNRDSGFAFATEKAFVA